MVAHPRNDHPASCRVVLQTPLGALSAVPRRSLSGHSSIVSIILACLLLSGGLILVSAVSSEPTAARLDFYSRLLAAGLLGLVWVVAVAQTIKELRPSDSRRALDLSERTGLAVLLEMARTWPASPYQPEPPARVPHQPERQRARFQSRRGDAGRPSREQKIELVLAAIGGQMLDFAGARAVFRMPSPAARAKIPTIHVLLLAPGIGQEIIISSQDLPRAGRVSRKEPVGPLSPGVAIAASVWPLARLAAGQGDGRPGRRWSIRPRPSARGDRRRRPPEHRSARDRDRAALVQQRRDHP